MLNPYQTLAEIVRIPSVSSQEAELADYMEARCCANGWGVTRLGDNVVVHIPGVDREKLFVLNGHLDTVPAIGTWLHGDPYDLWSPDSRNQDVVSGLGVSDMKGGLVSMLQVSEHARIHKPACNVLLAFSVKEEDAGKPPGEGAEAVAKWIAESLLPTHATIGGIILEPTVSQSGEFVGVGNRDDTHWSVRARREGGHASEEYEDGETAIEVLAELVVALKGLRARWRNKFSDPFLGAPSINCTVTKAGHAPNVVPPEGLLTLDLRVTRQLVPVLSAERERFARLFGVEIEQKTTPSPLLCSENERVYQAAKEVLPETPFTAFPAVTDAYAFFGYGIPMLIYGPGYVDQMHVPNEKASLRHISRCARMAWLMIEKF